MQRNQYLKKEKEMAFKSKNETKKISHYRRFDRLKRRPVGAKHLNFYNKTFVILLISYRFCRFRYLYVDNLVFFTRKGHAELDRISS